MRKYFILCLYILINFPAYSQFTGSSYDGSAADSTACPPYINICFGGSYAGASFDSIACHAYINISYGGSYDGFAYANAACPPSSAFTGGPFDGSAMGSIACKSPFIGGSYDGCSFYNISCAIPAIYFGGSYNGSAFNNAACVLPPDIYIGGSYDGFAYNSTACVAFAAICHGGSYDGFACNNTACPIPLDIFTGGSYDGFAYKNIACPPTIFAGGPFDGFARGSIACPSPFTGGPYDGFAVKSNACTIAAIYVGGSHDGYNNIYYFASVSCNWMNLPIELLYFNAKPNNDNIPAKVICNWATASEINNDYFTVEKTFDAINYSEVGKLKGAGNSDYSLYYSMVDENPYKGQSYYRLKQTDFNGNFTYSNLVAVNINSEVNYFNIYPNPANEKITIVTKITNSSIVSIYNIQGKLVHQQALIQEKTELNINWLPKGVYIVKVENAEGALIKRLLKD